jgi:hypothetical protein
MQIGTVKASAFTAGMYLLENLTSGMYNDPLVIYREYIQNAVDSLDLSTFSKQSTIDINLFPTERKVTFYDEGIGISQLEAEQILGALGSSTKMSKGLRGFRGIGRLGGLAFCEKATFRTKALGEKVESVQVWDCKNLKKMLAENNSYSLSKLFDKSTSFYQSNSKNPKRSYFLVELEGVTSFRNYIFDMKKVYAYLSQTAPVPFYDQEFEHGMSISTYLSKNLSSYSHYNIKLNGHRVFKPYKTKIKVTKKGYDFIDDIKFIEIKTQNETLAVGWYGIRRDFIGSIVKTENICGLRIRVGDILLGDEHLLNGCFREPRFNSYTIGEIHVVHPLLIPNSRRDDFIDNDYKTQFYDLIEKNIGLPLSKEIRFRSRMQSECKKPNVEKTQTLKHAGSKEKISLASIYNRIEKVCDKCPKKIHIINSLDDLS